MARVSLPALAAAGVLLSGSLAAAGDLKSGIDVGQSVKAFNPQHVTGPDAGKASCLV